MTDIEYLKKYLHNDKLEEGLKRLEQGEPVQYIVGDVNFYGYTFMVNKNVLIPRFETEELVNKTINYLKKYFYDCPKIVDLGTGSGCIAITLKKELPSSIISAVDVSEQALEIAKINAKNNNVDISFHLGNMLEPLKDEYDCIISNPPYIAYDEEIMPIVKNNEPSIALYADNNGLFFYELILSKAKKYLKVKSMLAFEIGDTQAEYITKLAKKYLPGSKVLVEKDMQDRDRFVFIFRNCD